MSQTEKRPKERFLRILVCLVAVLALLTAFTYMLFEIVTDSNETKRLLLEAFLDSGREDAIASVTTDSTTTAPITTVDMPTYRDIVAADLSASTPTVENATSYAIDTEALLEYPFSKHLFDTRPLILIYHTDPTASYAPSDVTKVPSDHAFQNGTQNVVTVAEAIVDVLRSAGIAAMHLTEPIDNIEAALEAYRQACPSIRYCLDVRRDGIYTTDGRIVKSDGRIDKTSVAQLMLCVGTGMGEKNLDWQKNLACAYRLTDMLHKASPSVVRPILLRPESLGQQSEIPHLTLFVGTTGNTADEAIASARFFARYLAIFILSNCGVDG